MFKIFLIGVLRAISSGRIRFRCIRSIFFPILKKNEKKENFVKV